MYSGAYPADFSDLMYVSLSFFEADAGSISIDCLVFAIWLSISLIVLVPFLDLPTKAVTSKNGALKVSENLLAKYVFPLPGIPITISACGWVKLSDFIC